MDDDARHVRIGDAERDAVVDQLKAHFAAGRLDLDELEERMGLALGARTRGELVPLTSDLPVAAPAAAPPAVVRPSGAAGDRAFDLHVRVAVLLAVVFVLVWVLTLGHLSPLPPLVAIGASVLVHWGWRRSGARR